MAPRPVTLRCTRCGNFVVAIAHPGASPTWYACPHCAAPIPVVDPRDPPPLFSWEVYPNLYPRLPPPRGPSPRLGTVVAVALLAATFLLAGLAGFLGFAGANALSPGRFSVHGTVLAAGTGAPDNVPLSGATVLLVGENGYRSQTHTASDGTFEFSGVPSGGFNLTVTDPGFAPVTVQLLATAPYNSAAGGVTITVSPGGAAQGSTVVATPFSSLENLVADLWSGASLFAFGAVVVAFGAAAAIRRRRPALVAASGAAAAISPAAFYLLGLEVLYPDMSAVASALVTLGILSATLVALPMALTGPAPDTGP